MSEEIKDQVLEEPTENIQYVETTPLPDDFTLEDTVPDQEKQEKAPAAIDLNPDNDEDLNEMEKMMATTADEKIVKASNRKFTKMRQEEHIFSEYGDVSIVNDTTMFDEDRKMLSAPGAIHSGVIVGTHKASDEPTATVCAKVKYGNGAFTVLIPYSHLFDVDIPKYDTTGTAIAFMNQMEARIMNMFGARVDFMVVRIDVASKTCYASRIHAMAKKFYLSFKKQSPQTGRPVILEGSKVMAQIVSLSSHHITLSAYGVDYTITNRAANNGYNEASWNYIDNFLNVPEFRVGASLPARVVSVNSKKKKLLTGKDLILGDCVLSLRQATEDPITRDWDIIHEGDIFQATVKGMNDENIFLLADCKYEVMCKRPANSIKQPELGQDSVIIKITTKTIEQKTGRKRLYGTFLRY
jgi:ribosomal protein S1